MIEIVIQAFLAGLSMGLFCSFSCFPFMAPLFVAERRNFSATIRVFLEFMGGRLAGYVAIGALFGYLGERLDQSAFNIISIGSLLVLSWVLILYGLGLIKQRFDFCARLGLSKRRTPLLMGLLMGINLCPPFILSVAYVFTFHSALRGIVYFLVFFVATTLYLIPVIFLGWLGRMNEFRLIARISAVLVGVIFSIYGIAAIVHGRVLLHMP